MAARNTHRLLADEVSGPHEDDHTSEPDARGSSLTSRKEMLSRIQALFRKEETRAECFTGIGVVLISDACATVDGALLNPATLIEVTSEMLSFQTDAIQQFGGLIDRYAGGCVVAYWPPKAMPGAISAASSAARVLVKKKTVGRVSFAMRVSFAVADYAVDAFGPAGQQRIQVIGRAYDRANAMQSKLPTSGIAIDLETFETLPESEKDGFAARDGFALCLG